MAMQGCPITVVIPVFDALPYLDRAIESVLAQSMSEFRLAIYDDHSSDGSYERALEWGRRDARIDVTRGDRRLGPSGSSAAAAALATTEFVARMDADDLAHPDRLAFELEVLLKHPAAVMVGSIFDMIDGDDRIVRSATPGSRTGGNPPIAHASIFYRRSAFEVAGGYREGTDYFEDQDLYRRMASVGEILIIDRPLIQLRFAGQHARLRDDRIGVLQQINRLYRPMGAASAPEPEHGIAPLAFYTVGVLSALGLVRPRLFGLMARHSTLDRPFLAFGIMAFIALAELSPRLARGVNGIAAKLRSNAQTAPADRSIRVWQFATD